MTTWEAMGQLENLGYIFTLNAEGRAVGQCYGKKTTETEALLQIARTDPESAAAYVRQRNALEMVSNGTRLVTMLDALAIGMAVRSGEAELLQTVVFHKSDLSVSICWAAAPGRDPFEILHKYRDKVERGVSKRLAEMRQADLLSMSAEEYERFCDQQSYYEYLMELALKTKKECEVEEWA